MKRVISIALIFYSHSLMATSCWLPFMEVELARQKGQEFDPIKSSVENADYVFVGKATDTMKKIYDSIESESYALEVVALFSVTETIKGPPDKKATIVSSHPPGSCSCIYDFEAGVEYLVFAKKIGDKYYTYYCQLIRPKDVSEYTEVAKFKS